MPHTAIFRVQSFSPTGIDRENGIVSGCQLAKLGKLAVFSDLEGNRRELLVTPQLIDGLLALFSEDERAPAHWSHDWLSSDADPIHSTVATWRNFRKDETGNLVADCFLWPTEKREAVLYAAEHDPEGMMVSMVFDYEGGRDDARALSVTSADLVSQGAATTALCHAVLSAHSQKHQTAKLSMDLEELKEALKDPATAAIIREIVNSEEVADAITPDEVADIEAVAEISPTEEEKKDAAPSALMKRYRRATLAIAKLAKAKPEAAEFDEEALLKKAEARFSKAIGNHAALSDFTSKQTAATEVETFITAQLAAGCKDRASAILRLAKDKPGIYNAAVKSGKL